MDAPLDRPDDSSGYRPTTADEPDIGVRILSRHRPHPTGVRRQAGAGVAATASSERCSRKCRKMSTERKAAKVHQMLEKSAARQVMLKSGNAYLEIFEFRSPPPHPADPERPVNDHGYTHFCVDVTDIDAEYERLSAAGMQFHCPPPRLGGGSIRATYGRDPDGNVVELQEIVDTTIDFALERTDLIGGPS